MNLAQINPHSGSDGNVLEAGIAAITEDAAASFDIGGTILTVAGRPQPPPAVAVDAINIRTFQGIRKTT